MSGTPQKKTVATRLAQLSALAVVFGVLWLASRLSPSFHGAFGVIAAVGLLLLAGMLASDLLEVIGLPHLTGYILAGIAVGPHALHFVDHQAVEQLQVVNTLALALIALAGGVELRIELLKRCFKSLVWTTLAHSTVGMLGMVIVFLMVARFLPFTAQLGFSAMLGVAVLWGVMANTRSPSATLGIFAQVRPEGPVSRFSLAFVMSSDVVAVVMLTLAITLVRPLIEPSAAISLDDIAALGHEIVGSLSLGTSLGLLLAIYLRLIGGQLLIPLIAIGFGLTEGLRYLHFDPVLTFLVAGFVVQNMTKQGEKLFHAVEQTGSVVYVVFFATAGAHLDVPLVRALWPVALFLCAARALVAYGSHRLGARLAGDEPAVREWGFACLISQAGLALGVAMVIARAFPSFGPGFAALAVATVAINELLGPVLFKLVLDRLGESQATRPEAAPIASEASA